MKTFIFSIFSILICVSAQASTISEKDAREVLARLDSELPKRDYYIELKRQNIELMRDTLQRAETDSARLAVLLRIGDAYKSLDADSAMIIYTRGYDKACDKGLDRLALIFRLRRAMILPLQGYFHEAVDEFEDIDIDQVPEDLRLFYHDSGRQMYSYIASSFTSHKDTFNHWIKRSNAHRDRLLQEATPGSDIYLLNRGEDLFDSGNLVAARDTLQTLVDRIEPDSNIAARANHALAVIASLTGDESAGLYHLAVSAIADIRSAVLEVMSLQELGERMWESGDIDRAYAYINLALDNAVECKASTRIVQTSQLLPIVQQMHVADMSSWQRTIYWVIGILVVALIVLAVMLFVIHRQVKKTNRLKNSLRDANMVKEVYISQFFRLCTIYIDRLNQFCKLTNRKISSGQVDELYKMTKSGKLVEEQSEEFYKLFDDAFLHIYPTFVEDVNKLLADKIVLKEGELLNNDLRILAFQRLGLDDTNQVALILNYSVNTIYAYRNKLRNRAFDRDNFERDIMRIGEI